MNSYSGKMKIKELSLYLGYERPIDLTRELASRGVLKHIATGQKRYVLTNEAIRHRYGEIGVKIDPHGMKRRFNLFFPERIKNLLKSNKILKPPDQIVVKKKNPQINPYNEDNYDDLPF